MGLISRIWFLFIMLNLCVLSCKCAKINTPRVLLPWFEDSYVNFTFEIIEGGCYTWSLSRDDVIVLEPLYEDSWSHCSRSARVSVSKSCAPPGSVIILAQEINTGEILRGDVDVDTISDLKVMSTTWKLFLEEAPEAFEVFAYDDQGNKFSTLEGISFDWTIENTGNDVGGEPLVKLVRWQDADYEAPHGITQLEAQGLYAHSVLLYGQAIGGAVVTVCLKDICTDFRLNVVASVVLMPATALVAPGDTLRYRVVRARAGRLTTQDIAETLYSLQVPNPRIALLEDNLSLVKGVNVGTTTIHLMSGNTEVATAILNVVEPYSIRVKLRPANLLIRGEVFTVHCTVLDVHGHALVAGDEMLIRLVVDGDANVDLLMSTENGTVTDAVARNAGPFTITAKLYSVGGKTLSKKVEGQISANAVDPLEVVPEDLYVAWTDVVQEIPLKYKGGGNEEVVWLSDTVHSSFSLTQSGRATIRGEGEMNVQVYLKDYPHIRASGRVWSAVPELIQVSTTGHARVGRPHHLHLALTASHPVTGELYNFQKCQCGSFAVTLLEGPEPQNVTAVTRVPPAEGACCVLEMSWSVRGVCVVRVARGRAGDAARVAVRAAPVLLWPRALIAALPRATLPVIAEGEALVPRSADASSAELVTRDGPPPHHYPDVQLFTLSCKKKGESRVELTSVSEGEAESVELQTACAAHVSRVRLEPPDAPGNCSAGNQVWLRPGQEVSVRVTLLDVIGRELLDERGPKMSWELEPKHKGIKFMSTDRLFVETHPDYYPVPVPYKYYQTVLVDDKAIGWSGLLKTSIPDASAAIQARVVAPLTVDHDKVALAWEGETVTNIAIISGGSGNYSVDGPKGVTAFVNGGVLSAVVPGPGTYDLIVNDLCVQGERQYVEVQIEEVVSVEVITSRAVCVSRCVALGAAARARDGRRLRAGAARWRLAARAGAAHVRGDQLCADQEGLVAVQAEYAGVWSPEVEVIVFGPLSVIPARAQVPPGARLQLRHAGGPPHHLASLHYAVLAGDQHVEVSSAGSVHGLSIGKARIKLVAVDIANVELASAESEVNVVTISSVSVESATGTLLVGAPVPLWVSAGGMRAGALAALQPAPRALWSLRDPSYARIYTTHLDDKLERSVAEGLSVRVVPLKPGVIVVDVQVMNIGKVAETRTWDSSIEILAISGIETSVEGLPSNLETGDRLALAVGAVVRLRSQPRSTWVAHGDGSFELTPSGEVKAIKPGYGVVVAQHQDERNNIYRESALHVEVGVPVYCTAEAVGGGAGGRVRVVARGAAGRALLAPHAAPRLDRTPLAAPVTHPHSVLGSELVITGLEPAGAFMTFEMAVGDVLVRDEVWVTGPDPQGDSVVACGGWGVCVEGEGWSWGAGVRVVGHAGLSLALLLHHTPETHVLRRDRPSATFTIHQVPIHKMEFNFGEWPYSMVPLSIEALSLNSGPILCSEDQRYALDGVQIELPFTCRTKVPHTAQAVLDIVNGQIGCSIIPADTILEASEVELCAEWSPMRTCTKVLLLPHIDVSDTKVSLLNPPTTFTVMGHPNALKSVRMTTTPGLKLESSTKGDEINVVIKSDSSACGTGYVTVVSKLTAQVIRVEVERECTLACGTLLGAIFSIIQPYLPTLMTIVAVAAAYLYIQTKMDQKTRVKIPTEAPVSAPPSPSPSLSPSLSPSVRTRTWARSPYEPVYGDASLTDSFSSTRMHSRIL